MQDTCPLCHSALSANADANPPEQRHLEPVVVDEQVMPHRDQEEVDR
jgi:hypothetical protein